MGCHIHLPEKETFYIILDGENVISKGSIFPGNCLDSAYDTVLTFESKEEFNLELAKYNLPVVESAIFDPVPLFELED